MCVPWNRAGARSKRHLLQTLIPQPSAVGATSIILPHLTGHVTGHVRRVGRDRFHALVETHLSISSAAFPIKSRMHVCCGVDARVQVVHAARIKWVHEVSVHL